MMGGWCVYKKRHRRAQWEDGQVRMEWEHLQAKEHQGLLAATRVEKRGLEQTSSEPPQGATLADTLVSSFWLPEL